MSKKYIILIAIFSAAGAFFSNELLSLHADPSSHSTVIDSLCSPDVKSGCRSVNSSEVSVLLGLPVALWGFFFYTLAFGLSVIYMITPEKLLLQALFLLSALALLVDIFFFIYMVAALQEICTICILTYLATTGIVVFSFLELRAQEVGLFPDFSGLERSDTPLALSVALLGLLVITTGGMLYLKNAKGKNSSAQRSVSGLPYLTYLSSAIDGFIREYDQAVVLPLSQEHSPRKGPRVPILEITEFADFLCPACRQAGGDLKRFFKNHSQEVSVTYRHYPLDMECNPAITQPMHAGACRLSYAAYCAQMQNRFWEMHDLIFSRQEQLHHQMKNPQDHTKVITGLARELSLNMSRFSQCLDSSQAKEAIARDINEAARMNISGTPAIFIDGKKSGYPVGFLLEQLIEVKSKRLAQ